MKRSQLSDMTVFVEVARASGFRAAADRLKLKAGSVSDAVQRLEDRLGVRLFERSTRSVVLTPLGERLYRRTLPAIDDLESAILELHELRDTVSGVLSLSAPYSAGPFFLDDLVIRFAARYPEVSIELIYDDRKIDLIESRVDAAIRSQTLLEPETYAVPVGPDLKMSIVASKAYIDRNGAPGAPDELMRHDGVCFAFGGADRLAPWNFEGEEGVYSVMPKPRMIANDLRSLLSYVEAGLGLAYVYAETAAPMIASGQLVEVLKDQVPSMPRYSLNYVTKRHMTRRLRAFIDMARE
ncbi:MAG: LysR family transcriptional regulator [Pseudomonadota bacterium]